MLERKPYTSGLSCRFRHNIDEPISKLHAIIMRLRLDSLENLIGQLFNTVVTQDVLVMRVSEQ